MCPRRRSGPSGVVLDRHRIGLDVTFGDGGAVTLADGIAWFDTTIDRHVEAGDHTIVLLRLHAAAHAEASRPLVFHRSGFGLDR